MGEREQLILLLQGVTLGAIVATGITYVLLKSFGDIKSTSNRHHGKEREIGRKSTRFRANSRSSSVLSCRTRSESPARRFSHRHSTSAPVLEDFAENEDVEDSLPQNHMSSLHYRHEPRSHVRNSSPYSGTPRMPIKQRDLLTDEEYGAPRSIQGALETSWSDSAAGVLSDTPLGSQRTQGRSQVLPELENRMRNEAFDVLSCHTSHSLHEFGRGMGTVIERGRVIDEAALQEDYCRVITPEGSISEESEGVCVKILEGLALREKWLFKKCESRRPENRHKLEEAVYPSKCADFDAFHFKPKPASKNGFRLVNGIFQVYTDQKYETTMFRLPGSASEFFSTLHQIVKFVNVPSVKTFCYQRLMLLEQKFNLHVMMNSDKESVAQKRAPHRDFYNIRKVDTHIHHSACMHQKHLLRFIKSKLKKEPNEVVIFRDGKYLTLKEVFESLELTSYDLNVDTLDMHADKHIFHRFDKFNLKYNPCGQSRLREIFLKQDNLIHGRFLAELTAEVFDDLKVSKYQHAEYRISIYGRKQIEWDILASWMCTNRLVCDNVVWLIQIPRLYYIHKESGVLEDFEEFLENVFQPLFEVTHDPSTHPQLHVFLNQVVGFDIVDDESRSERRVTQNMRSPKQWNLDHDPPYAYYGFYMYANLYMLNRFRESRGLNTFAFRPHCGEAGDVDHLICGFLLSENISHGINLRKAPALQYLYYLAQIGLCMSPLSNNSLFLDYHRNPFPLFFARGLSVSLSTDDPLQIHLTREPLVEEYSIAAQVWKLTSTDLCEIARNSVLHSGFPDECKKHWIGEKFWIPGPEGNDTHRTNVPNLRLRFRLDTYRDEMQTIHAGVTQWRTRLERSLDNDFNV